MRTFPDPAAHFFFSLGFSSPLPHEPIPGRAPHEIDHTDLTVCHAVTAKVHIQVRETRLLSISGFPQILPKAESCSHAPVDFFDTSPALFQVNQFSFHAARRANFPYSSRLFLRTTLHFCHEDFPSFLKPFHKASLSSFATGAWTFIQSHILDYNGCY